MVGFFQFLTGRSPRRNKITNGNREPIIGTEKRRKYYRAKLPTEDGHTVAQMRDTKKNRRKYPPV